MNIKEWLLKERVNRPEKDTSQDYAPTNGELLCMYVIFSAPLIVMPLLYYVLEVK